MIVLRNKFWSAPVTSPGQQQPQQPQQEQEITSRDLQLEQLRLQKQQRLIQHQKTQLQIKEGIARNKALQQAHKMEKEEDMADARNRLKIRQQEQKSQGAQNSSLYKTKSRPVAPVSMPK